MIWTDGRKLPKMLDGGVEIDGQYREQRIFGYSVGTWIDDNTLEITTIGTLPEDRVWLDSTGRPLSDQVKTTERLRRVSLDELEWSETIEDPKMYTKPWETMRLQMRLHDPAYRSHGVLLLTAGTGELRQVLRQRREPEVGCGELSSAPSQ